MNQKGGWTVCPKMGGLVGGSVHQFCSLLSCIVFNQLTKHPLKDMKSYNIEEIFDLCREHIEGYRKTVIQKIYTIDEIEKTIGTESLVQIDDIIQLDRKFNSKYRVVDIQKIPYFLSGKTFERLTLFTGPESREVNVQVDRVIGNHLYHILKNVSHLEVDDTEQDDEYSEYRGVMLYRNMNDGEAFSILKKRTVASNEPSIDFEFAINVIIGSIVVDSPHYMMIYDICCPSFIEKQSLPGFNIDYYSKKSFSCCESIFSQNCKFIKNGYLYVGKGGDIPTVQYGGVTLPHTEDDSRYWTEKGIEFTEIFGVCAPNIKFIQNLITDVALKRFDTKYSTKILKNTHSQGYLSIHHFMLGKGTNDKPFRDNLKTVSVCFFKRLMLSLLLSFQKKTQLSQRWLGHTIHTIQDSYSASHTIRKEKKINEMLGFPSNISGKLDHMKKDRPTYVIPDILRTAFYETYYRKPDKEHKIEKPKSFPKLSPIHQLFIDCINNTAQYLKLYYDWNKKQTKECTLEELDQVFDKFFKVWSQIVFGKEPMEPEAQEFKDIKNAVRNDPTIRLLTKFIIHFDESFLPEIVRSSFHEK